MKKIILLVSLLLSSALPAQILPCDGVQSTLDTVNMQLTANSWINTSSALVTVNINMTLNKTDLVNARNDIITKLNKIASGEWQITQFDRSQDNSGLEKLFVVAQARVAQTVLVDLYQQAKTISQAGATYAISSIVFKPSFAEIQAVKNQLREQLYQQANQVLVRLNKTYPAQHFNLHRLKILDYQDDSTVKSFKSSQFNRVAMATALPLANNLSVGNELTLTAAVEFAADRVQGASIATN